MEKDELQILANEANQLIKESNDVLYSNKLSGSTKKTSLEDYRIKLLNLRAKMNRIRSRRSEHQRFIDALNNKGNARGMM